MLLADLDLSHFLVIFSSSAAAIANIILIFLIGKHSRPEFGRYKYLMMLFAGFNIIYPLFHLVVMPGLHVVGFAFTFFVAGPLRDYISQNVGQWLLWYWVVLFQKELVLIVMHFLYRYIAVCRPDLAPHFKKLPAQLLLILYIFLDLGTWGYCFWTQSYWLRENRWYLKEDFAKFYGMDSETASVLGPLFKYNDTMGVERYRPYNVLCISLDISIVLYKFPLLVWFTVQINNTLQHAQMSVRTKRMQMELLKALIAQTACPFLMEGIPCFTTHLTAFFGVYIGPLCSWVLNACSLYPLLDAITMTYFIRDYRRAFVAKFLSLTWSRKYKVDAEGKPAVQMIYTPTTFDDSTTKDKTTQ